MANTTEDAALDFLEHLHKIFKGELKDETASSRDISNYFIKLPPKDCGTVS
jgi:hypothetical protein